MFLAFSPLAVVVGAGGWMGQGGEAGQEEGSLELFVAALKWVVASDAAAGAAGNWGQAFGTLAASTDFDTIITRAMPHGD